MGDLIYQPFTPNYNCPSHMRFLSFFFFLRCFYINNPHNGRRGVVEPLMPFSSLIIKIIDYQAILLHYPIPLHLCNELITKVIFYAKPMQINSYQNVS